MSLKLPTPTAPRQDDPVLIAQQAREKVIRARTSLILDEAFFGVLALRLVLVEDWTCETMWTDGVHLGYNPYYVMATPFLELKGVVCHEVLHNAAGHPWRRDQRDPEDWNVAGDYAINPIVQDAGFLLPQNVLLELAYKGMPAELIYKKVHRPKNPSGGSSDSSQAGKAAASSAGSPGDPTGAGQPASGQASGTAAATGQNAPSAPSGAGQGRAPAGEVRDAPAGVDKQQLAEQWRIATEQAVMAAKARGNLPGSLLEMVEEMKKPVVDWRALLWQFVQQSFYSPDYSWKMPHRGYLSLGMYLPALVGEQMPSVVVARDTSCSMSSDMLAQIYAEVKAILDEMRPEKTYAIDADTRIASVLELEPGEDFTWHAKGRGGTDFRPVFQWVEEQDFVPCCVIYLTDMDGPAPSQEPDYPVLWVTPPRSRKAPWGTQIEMPL